ncbi:MAG: adenylate/guanylate cyclase domain-containing protein [Candidatus Sericytochromatia bacterium]|nr:adenylate/guanylate cyclase domain-containing protein [Candidatus Sericytochromatia bacterium]
MNCPACTTAYEPEARFCVQCGGPAWFACDACQAWAAPGDRFCTHCGASVAEMDPLAAAGPSLTLKPMSQLGERRIVTVMFLEVLGLAQLQQTLDPEEVTELTNRFFKKLTDVVDAWGGVIDKYLADGLMVLFGAPVAREDDADRALMTALALRDTAREDMASAPAAKRLGIRIGLHTGLVVAGEVGGEAKRDYTVMGDTVNLAQRMKASATSEQILATPETVATTHRDFAIEELPEIQVKGRSKPVRPQAVIGLRSDGAAPPRDRVAYLPRLEMDHEWEATMAAGLSGRPQWLHVQGDAGVGKSRTLRRWKQALADSGDLRLLDLRGLAHKQDEAWALVRTIDGDQAPEVVQADILTQARRQLVALLIDDLDVVDAQSHGWLLNLWLQAQDTETGRSLMIVSASRALLAPVTARRDIHMAPLDLREAMKLFGAAADLPEPLEAWPAELRELARETVDQTGGNPLFLVELARDLVSGGWIRRTEEGLKVHRDSDGLPLPSAMSAILMSHLDTLPPDQRTLLSAAAVAGPGLHAEMLGHLGPVEAIRHGLRSLVTLGLLEARDEGGFRFLDAALHEVAYQGVLQAQRRLWHEAAADALVADPAMAGEKGISALLAHHLLRAGQPDKALGHALVAADDADHPGGWAKTARVLRTLVTPQAPPLLAEDRDVAAALSALARVETRLGWYERALDHARQALTLAGQVGEQLAAREQMARLLLDLGQPEEALAVLDEAGSIVGQGYAAWWGLRAVALLATGAPLAEGDPCRAWAEREPEHPDLALATYLARPTGRKALAQARALVILRGDPCAAILAQMALEDLALERFEDAVLTADQAARAWDSLGRPDQAHHVRLLAIEALGRCGRVEEAVSRWSSCPPWEGDAREPRGLRLRRTALRLAMARNHLADLPGASPAPTSRGPRLQAFEQLLDLQASLELARISGKSDLLQGYHDRLAKAMDALLPDLAGVEQS